MQDMPGQARLVAHGDCCTGTTTAHAAPLPALAPINLLGDDGMTLRNDGTKGGFAYAAPGDGTSPPEQYIAHNPTNLSDTTPIQPGQQQPAGDWGCLWHGQLAARPAWAAACLMHRHWHSMPVSRHKGPSTHCTCH
jgi:hypothetical protein